nr:hypothetical protein [Ruminococcus bromii]
MGSSNPQSRKWLLTINNPDDYELDHNAVKNTLHLFSPDYFCLVDEIATTGTKHMHIFIYSKLQGLVPIGANPIFMLALTVLCGKDTKCFCYTGKLQLQNIRSL